MTINTITSIMRQKGETVFYDCEFKANDLAPVYLNVVNDTHFNIAIHWRRPSQFIDSVLSN